MKGRPKTGEQGCGKASDRMPRYPNTTYQQCCKHQATAGYQDLARCLVEKRGSEEFRVGTELSHRAHASMCNVLALIPSTENIFQVWMKR